MLYLIILTCEIECHCFLRGEYADLSKAYLYLKKALSKTWIIKKWEVMTNIEKMYEMKKLGLRHFISTFYFFC